MSKYDKMVSIYINVDNENFSEILQTYQISSLPTQIITILKDNQLLNIHKLEGYNWNKLESMYEDSVKYLKNESETESEKDNEKENTESNNNSTNESSDESSDESS